MNQEQNGFLSDEGNDI